jgi:hypothetical protein
MIRSARNGRHFVGGEARQSLAALLAHLSLAPLARHGRPAPPSEREVGAIARAWLPLGDSLPERARGSLARRSARSHGGTRPLSLEFVVLGTSLSG